MVLPYIGFHSQAGPASHRDLPGQSCSAASFLSGTSRDGGIFSWGQAFSQEGSCTPYPYPQKGPSAGQETGSDRSAVQAPAMIQNRAAFSGAGCRMVQEVRRREEISRPRAHYCQVRQGLPVHTHRASLLSVAWGPDLRWRYEHTCPATQFSAASRYWPGMVMNGGLCQKADPLSGPFQGPNSIARNRGIRAFLWSQVRFPFAFKSAGMRLFPTSWRSAIRA